MTKQVEFFFDVGSPNAYFAYRRLPEIAARHNASIGWRPMLLGGVFKATGNRSPIEVPAKARWLRDDLRLSAEYHGIEFRRNPHFPVNTLAIMRGAVGLQREDDEEAFTRYLDAAFRAMWVESQDLADPQVISRLVASVGIDPEAFQAMITAPEIKAELKTRTEDAVARGVFGAPTFIVGEDLFFGQDRMHFVEQALAAPGGSE